jgi:hypothetical protein
VSHLTRRFYNEKMRTLCIAALAFALTPLAGAEREVARLSVVSENPLVVRGTGFAPKEVVLVKADGARSRTILRRASKAGAFRVGLGRTKRRACAVIVVRAIGSQGSRATLRWAPACVGP